MLNPNDIIKYNKLTNEQKKALEKKMQATDLNYLSSVSFEQFNVTTHEIEELNQLVDRKTKGGSGVFNTVFISVLCGLFIGISIFFVIFQKSKNHPSVYQSIEEEKAQHKLENFITAIDTVFPKIETKNVEHYNTIVNNAVEMAEPEMIETLPSKPLDVNLSEQENEKDIIFQFTPNAPTIFIHNLKITNYRLYYFKQNQSINLSSNLGLSAQYGNASDIEKTNLNTSNVQFAHKIIQKAMRLFNSKNNVNCIEELSVLYEYNPDDANAQFYLGMCYYQLGKYAIAQTYFQKNLDNLNNIFHQESEFYQALCLLNLKQTDEATKLLQYIANNKGFYSERAKETINKQIKN